MIRVGILSDTHIQSISNEFLKSCTHCFDGCDAIIHAGDLTESAILNVFRGKEIYAVHGNMCNVTTKMALPALHSFAIGGCLFGLTHGANGPRHNIEDRVFSLFPDTDCIVFGHTHQPLIRKIAGTLLINPGSFHGTGRYGAPGTYCLLTIDGGRLSAQLHERTA